MPGTPGIGSFFLTASKVAVREFAASAPPPSKPTNIFEFVVMAAGMRKILSGKKCLRL